MSQLQQPVSAVNSLSISSTWRRLTGIGDDNAFIINVRVSTDKSNVKGANKRQSRMLRSSTISRSFAGKSLRKAKGEDDEKNTSRTLKLKVPFGIEHGRGPVSRLAFQAGLKQITGVFGLAPDKVELLLPSADVVIEKEEKWFEMVNDWIKETAARRTSRIGSIFAKCMEGLSLPNLRDDLTCFAMHALWEVSTNQSFELHFTPKVLECIFDNVTDVEDGQSNVHYFALMTIANLLVREGGAADDVVRLNGHRRLLYHAITRKSDAITQVKAQVNNKHRGIACVLRAVMQSKADPVFGPTEQLRWCLSACHHAFDEMSSVGVERSLQHITKLVCEHGPEILVRGTGKPEPTSEDKEEPGEVPTEQKEAKAFDHVDWVRKHGSKAGKTLQPPESTELVSLAVQIIVEYQRIPPEMLLKSLQQTVPDQGAQEAISIEMKLLWLLALVAGTQVTRNPLLMSLPLLETLLARLCDWLSVPKEVRQVDPVRSLIELNVVICWGIFVAFDEALVQEKAKGARLETTSETLGSKKEVSGSHQASAASAKGSTDTSWFAFQADQLLQQHLLEMLQIVFGQSYSPRTKACALSIIVLRAAYPDMCQTLVKAKVAHLLVKTAQLKSGVALKCFASVATRLVHLCRHHGRLLRHQNIIPFCDFVHWCIFQSNEQQVQRCGAHLFMDLCSQTFCHKRDPVIPSSTTRPSSKQHKLEARSSNIANPSEIQAHLSSILNPSAMRGEVQKEKALAVSVRLVIKIFRLCSHPSQPFKPTEFYVCFATMAAFVPVLQTKTVPVKLGSLDQRQAFQKATLNVFRKGVVTLGWLADVRDLPKSGHSPFITGTSGGSDTPSDDSPAGPLTASNLVSFLQLALISLWELLRCPPDCVPAAPGAVHESLPLGTGGPLAVAREFSAEIVAALIDTLEARAICQLSVNYDRVIFLATGVLWNVLNSPHVQNGPGNQPIATTDSIPARFGQRGMPSWARVTQAISAIALHQILRVDTRVRATALYEVLFKDRHRMKLARHVKTRNQSLGASTVVSPTSETQTGHMEQDDPDKDIGIPQYDAILVRLLSSTHLDIVRFAAQAISRNATNAARRLRYGKLGGLRELLRLIRSNTTMLDSCAMEDLLLAILALSCTAENQLEIVRCALRSLIDIGKVFEGKNVSLIVTGIIRNCAKHKLNRTKLFKAELTELSNLLRGEAIGQQDRQEQKSAKRRNSKSNHRFPDGIMHPSNETDQNFLDSLDSSTSTVLTAADALAGLLKPAKSKSTKNASYHGVDTKVTDANSNHLRDTYESWLRMVEREASARKKSTFDRLAGLKRASKSIPITEGLCLNPEPSLSSNQLSAEPSKTSSTTWDALSNFAGDLKKKHTKSGTSLPLLNHHLSKALETSLIRQASATQVSNKTVYSQICIQSLSSEKNEEPVSKASEKCQVSNNSAFWSPHVKGYSVATHEQSSNHTESSAKTTSILVYPNSKFHSVNRVEESSKANPMFEQMLREESPAEYLARCSKTSNSKDKIKPSVTLSQFRHVPGATLCSDLYEHTTMPNGEKIHLFAKDTRIEFESTCVFVPPVVPRQFSNLVEIKYPVSPAIVDPFQLSQEFLAKFEAHLIGPLIQFPFPMWGHTFDVETERSRTSGSKGSFSSKKSIMVQSNWSIMSESSAETESHTTLLGRYSTRSLAMRQSQSEAAAAQEAQANPQEKKNSLSSKSGPQEAAMPKPRTNHKAPRSSAKGEGSLGRKGSQAAPDKRTSVSQQMTSNQARGTPPRGTGSIATPGSAARGKPKATPGERKASAMEPARSSMKKRKDNASGIRGSIALSNESDEAKGRSAKSRNSRTRQRTTLIMVEGKDMKDSKSRAGEAPPQGDEPAPSAAEKPKGKLRRDSGRAPAQRGKRGSLTLAGGVIAGSSRQESRFGAKDFDPYFDPYWRLKDDFLNLHLLMKKVLRPKIRRRAISNSSWDPKNSMFKRNGENSPGGLEECERLADGCREKDWQRLTEKVGFVRYFARSFNEVSRKGRKKLTPEDEMRNVKELMFQYYNPLMNIFRHFSTRGTDPFSLSLIALSELMTECGVMAEKSRRLKKKDLDNIFIASAVQDKNLKENANNPKTGLIRSEFLEAIFRVAIAKYGSSREKKDCDILPSVALEKLLRLHFAEDDDGDEYGASDPNYFRSIRMYNRAVDIVLKSHQVLLKHLFDKSIAWEQNKPGKMMSIPDWLGFLDRFGLITKEHTERDAVFNFLTGKLPTINELLRRNEYKCCRFLDFCEMLCRVVDTVVEIEPEEVPKEVVGALKLRGAFNDEDFGVHLAFKLHYFIQEMLLPILSKQETVKHLKAMKFSEVDPTHQF